ncbi:MAG: UDP-N-acetylglucosamine--N-acetylmuramyl-(pentapeptide) pyrophosphoryl-undecaprenol N-acetylglucosamine transferase [Candidatus Nealsonbacteria bacterium]|nr:UDP-N-acetylglucosamine--N-acetylmuramyl-(pentapeptide) pyrophosphoryl-undecaprenol N-acetylglucosamine transferase [Candidatus Nealsonbacteria bacterium]
MKILFTGGGSAGHIFPILAVARELRRLGLDWKFFYLGPKDDFGSILLSQEDIKIKNIFSGKIRRYLTLKSVLQNIFDILFKIPLGFIQSFFYIFFSAPDLTFSKGGYGSAAPVFCSWFLQVPILLHESDAAPGLANQLLSKLVSEILVSFPISQTEYFSEKKMISVGNPIRTELLEGAKDRAKKLFGLTGEKPIILIVGGSQGAEVINDTILEILPQMLVEFELIHQTGEKNFQEVKNEAKVMISKELEKYYHPIGFLKEMELREAYAASDIILSRAGSGSIFEIAAAGKPSILIPLALAAQDHQAKNAYAYADGSKGAALVIEESNLTPHFLLEKIKYLFALPGELERMSKAAKTFAKPESGRLIAEYIMNYYKK